MHYPQKIPVQGSSFSEERSKCFIQRRLQCKVPLFSEERSKCIIHRRLQCKVPLFPRRGANALSTEDSSARFLFFHDSQTQRKAQNGVTGVFVTYRRVDRVVALS